MAQGFQVLEVYDAREFQRKLNLALGCYACQSPDSTTGTRARLDSWHMSAMEDFTQYTALVWHNHAMPDDGGEEDA